MDGFSCFVLAFHTNYSVYSRRSQRLSSLTNTFLTFFKVLESLLHLQLPLCLTNCNFSRRQSTLPTLCTWTKDNPSCIKLQERRKVVVDYQHATTMTMSTEPKSKIEKLKQLVEEKDELEAAICSVNSPSQKRSFFSAFSWR